MLLRDVRQIGHRTERFIAGGSADERADKGSQSASRVDAAMALIGNGLCAVPDATSALISRRRHRGRFLGSVTCDQVTVFVAGPHVVVRSQLVADAHEIEHSHQRS